LTAIGQAAMVSLNLNRLMKDVLAAQNNAPLGAGLKSDQQSNHRWRKKKNSMGQRTYRLAGYPILRHALVTN
jgi:hypothetical protein